MYVSWFPTIFWGHFNCILSSYITTCAYLKSGQLNRQKKCSSCWMESRTIYYLLKIPDSFSSKFPVASKLASHSQCNSLQLLPYEYTRLAKAFVFCFKEYLLINRFFALLVFSEVHYQISLDFQCVFKFVVRRFSFGWTSFWQMGRNVRGVTVSVHALRPHFLSRAQKFGRVRGSLE